MRQLILSFVFLFALGGVSFAQRYAYVDTQYILDNIPEYQSAQEELNRLSEEWQQEIELQFQMVAKKRQEFADEAILLPAEIKKQREKEISEMETKAMELQKRRFGVGGDLFMKREQLIKPIQDRIFDAIQQIATERNYAFVFDIANQSNLLYADPKYDISEDVIRKMGIKIDKN